MNDKGAFSEKTLVFSFFRLESGDWIEKFLKIAGLCSPKLICLEEGLVKPGLFIHHYAQTLFQDFH